MNSIRLRRLASLAGAIAIVPSVISAQESGAIIVTPYVGLYAPTTSVAKLAMGTSGMSARLDAKHQSAAAFGANVSYWLSNRFALEGGAVYTGSSLKSSGLINELSTITTGTETQHARLWLGSAKLMMQLFPSESDFNLRFGFGPAVISRGGTAYRADADGKFTGLTDFGAAFSLCSRFNVTPSVGIRLRAEDYLYQSKLGWKSATDPTESFTFNERTQHDFVLSAGLQLFLNR